MEKQLIPPGTRELRMADVYAEVQRLHGRPIRLVPANLPPTFVCGGLVVATDGPEDWIVYPAGDGVRGDQILLHEFAHLLFGDDQDQADTAGMESVVTDNTLAVLHLLLPDLPVDLLRTLRARTTYAQPSEQRAELFATKMAARLRQLAPYQHDQLDSPGRPRLRAGFGVSDADHLDSQD